MQGLWQSIKELSVGVLRRFLLWLPFLLLDISDYWEKYIQPTILHFTGEDLVMPEGALIVGAVIGVCWSAVLTFHELRKDKVALDNRLEPTVTIDPTPALQQSNERRKGGRLRYLFYATIKNPSAMTLRKVGMYLIEIKPPIPELDLLPVPMHIKHDNSRPPRESFDMNPGAVRHVDIVSQWSPNDSITIEHSVTGGLTKAIPNGTYLLTVQVEGENIANPERTKFLIKLDPRGRLVCLAGGYVDLDKGLFELRRDAKYALEHKLRPAIHQLTKSTRDIAAAVLANEQLRILTHVTRSMRLLGDTLDGIIKDTENFIEAIDMIDALTQQGVET